MTMLTSDAFWMELHAFDGQVAVAQAHDRAVFQPGRDLKAVGQTLAVNDQGMIARALKRRWKVGKDTLAVVMHRTELAMHDLARAHDLATERLTDCLVAKAHPQQGRFRLGGGGRQGQTNARFVRVTRTGRQDDPTGIKRHRLLHIQRIVAVNRAFCAQFAQVMDQIKGKAVIIVD